MTALRKTRRASKPDAHACAGAVIELMPAVMDAMRAAMRRHIRAGLSVAQFRCLNYIDLHPGASLGEVAAFLGVTLPTVSATVDRLVRAGYLTANTSAIDRRRSELRVVKAGSAILASMRKAVHLEFTRTLERSSAAELEHLSLGLAVLRVAFEG